MDIKAAVSALTPELTAEWLGEAAGWDRWASGLVITEDGPLPLVVGVLGVWGVTTGPVGVSLHPHSSTERAIACWEKLARELAEMALFITDGSQMDLIPQESVPAALPVSDESSPRGFGWL